MRIAIAFVILTVGFSEACNSKTEVPIDSTFVVDSADQIMWPVKFSLTDGGVRRVNVEADTAYLFDNSMRIELRRVHATFYSTTGIRNSVLTSRRGTANTLTANVIARGNVVLTGDDGRRLTTEELIYDQGANEISSDSAFVLTQPDRRIEGIGFRSDLEMKNFRILKGASGVAMDASTRPASSNTSSPTIPRR
jgi:LPS export ABC transporter protein LptC